MYTVRLDKKSKLWYVLLKIKMGIDILYQQQASKLVCLWILDKMEMRVLPVAKGNVFL